MIIPAYITATQPPVSTLFICSASYIYYEDRIEKKKIVISENYIEAKLNLENGDKKK